MVNPEKEIRQRIATALKLTETEAEMREKIRILADRVKGE